MEQRPGLGQLCRLLLKHAAFTVGGGSVTTVALERDFVEDEKWLSQDRFRTIYGLARLTPGTSILALTTGLGWDFYRWRGALLGLVCVAIPGSILAALLAAGYQEIYQNDIARRFMAGAAAAVCGFIAASVLKMIQPYLGAEQRLGTAVIFVAVLAVCLLGVSPFPVFVGLGVLGYLLPDGAGK